MNKSVLMAFSPYWYYLIMEGIKKIEVRKTIPKDPNWNRQVECYMTKDKKSFARIPKESQEKYRAHFGKVGMRFVCDRIDEFHEWQLSPQGKFQEAEQKDLDNFLQASCLSYGEICTYRKNLPYYKPLYGWHISDLKIYNTPKELREFNNPCTGKECSKCQYEVREKLPFGEIGVCCGRYHIIRPFQSWGYVEDLCD